MGEEEEDGTILGRAQAPGLPLCHPPRPCSPVATVASLEKVLLVSEHKPFPQILPHRLEFSNPTCAKSKARRDGGKKISMKKSGKTNTKPRGPVVLTRTGI